MLTPVVLQTIEQLLLACPQCRCRDYRIACSTAHAVRLSEQIQEWQKQPVQQNNGKSACPLLQC